MTTSVTPELQQLPIWQCLQDRGSAEQVYRVGRLVDIATAKLTQIRDTFPTYTIHDREHANNVTFLMGQLLGDRVQGLSALEAGMLVLSAYFHDTGMAFSENERTGLQTSEHFTRFLIDFPAAEVAIETSDHSEVPIAVAESFCRWRHAERVFEVLHDIAGSAPELLRWGAVDISEQLGHICQSHNLDAGRLTDDTMFPIDFLTECDARFVALMLRLADILDFDRSRSPEQLYRDLGLAAIVDSRGKTSDLEWRKHLASDGFKFPTLRVPGYPIGCIAGPDEPAVEHDIRQFLDLIEGEFGRCGSVIRSCSDSWRTHPLPGKIDRGNLRGNGYTYGDYRFTLEQHEILNLLMGDRLYKNPYTFVRELIQNALDASRHREFHEQASGNTTFACEPVRVSSWVDADGYQWVEVEDQGMGMTEETIRNFLLKVGRSYYSSSRFEADVIRYSRRTREHFCPVSRYGIGLLSCFIAGDRVEIATRHAVHGDGSLRLSLPGLESFFVLQRTPNPLRPMPNPRSPKGAERRAGTTVAVRLDARREQRALDVRFELEEQLLCSPIPVLLEGQPVGLSAKDVISRPWCDPREIRLSHKMTTHLGEVLGHTFSKPPVVRLIPLDITGTSPIPEIAGQLVVAFIEDNDEWMAATHVRELTLEELERKHPEEKTIRLSFADDGNRLVLGAWHSEEAEDWEQPVERHAEFEFRIKTTWRLAAGVRHKLFNFASTHRQMREGPPEYVAHNGIRLPSSSAPRYGVQRPLLTTINVAPDCMSWGVLTLRDRLRPDLSIAREETVAIDWPIRSAALLALRRALRSRISDKRILKVKGAFTRLTDQLPALSDATKDPLIADVTMWPTEKIFTSGSGDTVSVVDLLNAPGLYARISAGSSDLAFVRMALARMQLAARLEVKDSERAELVVSRGPVRPVSESEKLFPPLTFVPFTGEFGPALQWKALSVLRLDHPFSLWLLRHATTLQRDLKGLFSRLRDCLADLHTWRGRSVVSDINTVLKRIGELRPDLAPPDNALIRKEDVPFLSQW